MRTAARRPTAPTFALIAVLLAMAVLYAQWSGLVHSIAHAGWQQNPGVQISGDQGEKLQHSCLAFDAATLAATVCTSPFIAPLLPNAHVLALWIAFISWEAPFTAHFSSRAPPSPDAA